MRFRVIFRLDASVGSDFADWIYLKTIFGNSEDKLTYRNAENTTIFYVTGSVAVATCNRKKSVLHRLTKVVHRR